MRPSFIIIRLEAITASPPQALASSLLQPALACDAMLYPVAIRYTRADGSLCREADYEGDKSMVGSLLLMVTQPVGDTGIKLRPFLSLDFQGQLYADLLRRSGIPVRYTCHQGMIHHFYGMAGVIAYARTAMSAAGAAIKSALS